MVNSDSTPGAPQPLLKQLVWRCLSGDHAALAQHNAHAMRYRPDIAPFGGLEEQNARSVEDLARLMNPGEEVCLIDQEANVSHLFEAVSRSEAVQMVYSLSAGPSRSAEDIRQLTQADLPGMESLIAAVFPGYFRRRTHEMGRYYGIFIEGQLAAMAGERLTLPGLREISSICTHLIHQGKGFAARLTHFLVGELQDNGIRPFLHVGAQNLKARRLYAKLGFEEAHLAAINLYRRK